MAEPTRPLLVEVTGVAGAGKSTLVRLLCRADPTFRRAEFIQARTPRHLAYIIASAPRLVPTLLRNLGPGPRLSWADVKLIVYVTRWRRLLSRAPAYRQGVTLLDQGPLYALVRLKAQGKRVTSGPGFERWWNEMLEVWGRELDVVVVLDAGDRILWDRINGREQPHRTKGGSVDVGLSFLGRYRRLFDEALARVDRPGGPEILHFDSGATPSERIAAELQPFLARRLGRDAADSEGRR